ncbi:MAG: S1C family serine protease, partial [Acidimicrobiia bacterium]|nr:S1C family serine protease [Acidimicrobiia bacterium]
GVLGFTGVLTQPTSPTIPPAPTLTAPPPTSAPPTFEDNVAVAQVAERAIPSIVSVEVSTLLSQGGGSGVVYGGDGYIVTNHHVVDGARELAVVFSDGARFSAELVGSDPLTDLAVLLVERDDLTSIDLGTSASISIGQTAIAVGNPLGLVGGPSVTAGIVSALNRSLAVDGANQLYGLVQTDAPITRGSSGGALLDSSARLIGITTAIAVSDVGAEGLGFAIPIDMVVGIVTDLIEDGQVEHALLGISGTTALAESGNAEYPVGVSVTGILADSAFAAAGGQVNDVITSIAGDSVTTLDEMLTQIRLLRANAVVTITVIRGDSETDLRVTMGRLEP